MLVHYASAAITLLLAAGAASAADHSQVGTEVLVQSTNSWNGKPFQKYPNGQPQLTVVRMTIPAHTVLPWHVHPMPNATYILSGHITVEDRATGQKRLVSAGEAFNEQADAEHRGFTDSEDCVVVVTYAGTPGMPRSIESP